MARKQVKELPEKIDRLERRIAHLTQDMATAKTHEHDRIVIDGRPREKEDVHAALAAILWTVPTMLFQHHCIPFGVYRGLAFSLDLSPRGNRSVCVEGAATRFLDLSSDCPGPRAVMNAVGRLVDSYELIRDRDREDLKIAQGQLHDYEARIGGVFSHERYLEDLAGLRNQLDGALCSTTQAHDTDELVEQIKALRAANTIEASPERTPERKAAAMEEWVTTRITRDRDVEPEVAIENIEEEAEDTPP
jgi:hypothetical protein